MTCGDCRYFGENHRGDNVCFAEPRAEYRDADSIVCRHFAPREDAQVTELREGEPLALSRLNAMDRLVEQRAACLAEEDCHACTTCGHEMLDDKMQHAGCRLGCMTMWQGRPVTMCSKWVEDK